MTLTLILLSICLACGLLMMAAEDLSEGALAAIIVAFILFIPAVFISSIVENANQGHEAIRDKEPAEVWYPVSLSDNFGTYGEIHGGLFVISGFVETFQFYSWYEENPDGSLVPNRVSERSGYIKVFEEKPGTRPTIEKYEFKDRCTDYETNWTFGLAPCDPEHYEDSYEIHVPKGTIIRQFQLDSK